MREPARHDAYAEDQTPAFRLPSVTLLSVTACERCAVVTVDQQTGDGGVEPLATLSRYRRREENYAGGVMFGMYVTADASATLRVGDVLAT